MTFWSILTLLIGFNNVDKFFATHGIQDEQPYRNIFMLGSYNMQWTKYVTHELGQKKNNEKLKDYYKFLLSFKELDIFCGQELSKDAKKWVAEQLAYKHQHVLEDKSTAIYSKHLIIDKGIIEFGTKVNSCVWADIKVKKDTIRVYNTHLQSNKISGTESKLIEQGKWEKETFTGLRQMFDKYQKHSSRRTEQAIMIRKHASTSPHPYIICGDFNDPPQSYVYQTISKNLNDSFIKAGSGLGTSFNGVIPALRIDYLLAQDTFDIYAHKIMKQSYSDHFPIIGKFALP